MFFNKKTKQKAIELSDNILSDNSIAKNVLRHIAIIMDGNGRWAAKLSLPRSAGHKAGFDRFVKTVDECARLGLEYLTVYALSTENWSRPADEINALLKIMNNAIVKYVPKLMEKNIRLRILGDITRFDEKSCSGLIESEIALSANTGMTLSVALSYGGRAELVRAVSVLVESKKEINEQSISECLYTASIPDPDLIIRTGDEMRISNFLLWQCAYSEYYFSKKLWPDFDNECLHNAIRDYFGRSRRYGKL